MPTVRRCCIVGCLSNSRQNPALQFFQFPKPENPFHKLWKQACHASLSRILPFKKPVVCALHFAPNCIGGRRLTSSAVPSMRLEVPSNLKAVEQQAMVDEIERSRKCAYINAVVYEWLVRANLNPQLRGSITHGMIKEKADTAKQLIGSTAFVADNRWLNRFRETHLTGFAQKLATNQLKPLGPSLWIPDIVQDLQHLFPPTSADRVANFENVPEQYIGYMQQYGEYEEDDDQDQSMDQPLNQSYDQKPYAEQKPLQHYQQQQQQHHFDGYGHHQGNYGYNNYYYNDYQNQQHNYTSPHHHQQNQYQQQQQQHHQQLQQQQQQQISQATQQRPQSQSPAEGNSNRSSPYSQSNGTKRKLQDDDDVKIINGNGNSNSNDNDNNNDNDNENENDIDNSNSNDAVEDLTDGPEPNQNSNGKTPLTAKTNGSSTPQSSHSNSVSPKPTTNGQNNSNGASIANGHTTPIPTQKELTNYAQAVEYLKPLEDFALFKENFRAIGLISQLEIILRKGTRMPPADFDD